LPHNIFSFFTGATTLCGSWPPQWFRNSKYFLCRVVSPRPTPNLEDQGLHSVWPLPFDLSGMGGATRSLRSRQHSSPGHWDTQSSSPRQGGSPRGGHIVLGPYTNCRWCGAHLANSVSAIIIIIIIIIIIEMSPYLTKKGCPLIAYINGRQVDKQFAEMQLRRRVVSSGKNAHAGSQTALLDDSGAVALWPIVKPQVREIMETSQLTAWRRVWSVRT
jgi:hypothetical protein